MGEEYEIFLSFSGEKSKKFAKQLKDLLKELSIGKVFFSEEDINGGDKWLNKIQMALKTSKVGIICFTEENIHKPWLFLEYGAFAYKQFLDKNEIQIIPLFLDFTNWDDNPLKTDQAIVFKSKTIEDALKETVTQLNNYIYDKKDENTLLNKIDNNLSTIEEIKKILEDVSSEPIRKNSTEEQIVSKSKDCDDLDSHLSSLENIKNKIKNQPCCKNSIKLENLDEPFESIEYLKTEEYIELFSKATQTGQVVHVKMTLLGISTLLYNLK